MKLSFMYFPCPLIEEHIKKLIILVSFYQRIRTFAWKFKVRCQFKMQQHQHLWIRSISIWNLRNGDMGSKCIPFCSSISYINRFPHSMSSMLVFPYLIFITFNGLQLGHTFHTWQQNIRTMESPWINKNFYHDEFRS